MLLAYLALASRGHGCRRATLLALFWPDREEHRARNALNQAVHDLRRALGGRVILTRGDEEIAIAMDRLWCDATALREAIDDGRHEEALSLYRGPLLDGVHVAGPPELEDWLDVERERWRARAAGAASVLARAEQARGRIARAVHWLKRLLDLSPDDESALRQLMVARRATGDAVGALHDYQRFARRLGRDLDVPPATETKVLADRIRDELRGPRRTLDPDSPAYDPYWRGLVHWSRRAPDEIRKSAAQFRKAIAADPGCSQPYAGFAMAASALGAAFYDMEPPELVYPAMKAMLAKALSIDDQDPQALASLAVMQALYERNWSDAETHSLRACALAPDDAAVHHARAVVAVYSGRLDEAMTSIGRAASLEPLVLGYQEIAGWYLYLARRHHEAIHRLQRTLDLEPRLYLARLGLGHARAALGDARAAEAAYVAAMEIAGRHPYPLTGLGVLYARTSRPGDARRILDELSAWAAHRYVRPTYLAALSAALGDVDTAFARLEQALAERDVHLTSIVVDPFFDTLRADRRFPALLGRAGVGA